MEERTRTQHTSWDFEKAARMLAAGNTLAASQVLGRDNPPQTDTAIEAPSADHKEPDPCGDGKGDAETMPMPPALLPRYMSAEDWHEMERAAARGAMPTPGMDAGKRMLYFALVGLYAAHRSGIIPAGIAKIEKRLAIEAYNGFAEDRALYMRSGEFYKNVEAACTAFAKDGNYRNAKAMYQAVYHASANARMQAKSMFNDGGDANESD